MGNLTIKSTMARLTQTSVGAMALRVLITLSLSLTVAHAGYTVRVPLADGFDQSVGKPDARGYYVFRGFYPNGHLGEDWNGNGGGDTDLGDPVCAIGDGVVIFSEDYKRRWGNVVIVRHAFRNADGKISMIDSLYGHLDRRMVRQYQVVRRGQQLGTIGNCYGIYAAHLHLEVRKNLQIGMARSSYARDYSNYYSPRSFIAQHRTLNSRGETFNIPVDGVSTPEISEDANNQASSGNAKMLPIRTTSKATGEDAKRQQLEDQLKKMAEENKKKTAATKDEDMDTFWSRLKNRLGGKK
jgi:hypothetical protein